MFCLLLLLSGTSVAYPDPGSGAFLTPGSGVGFFRIPDLGSRISNAGSQTHIWELSDNFLGKKFYNSLKIGPNFFLQHFKTKIIFNLWNLWLHKKVYQQIFFHPSLFLLFLDPRIPGSGMGKNQNPGSGINIPDPQHCLVQYLIPVFTLFHSFYQQVPYVP